jgi:hypothetical protein
MERWFYSVEDFTSEIDISVPPSPQDLNIPPGRSTMQSLEETLRWHCKNQETCTCAYTEDACNNESARKRNATKQNATDPECNEEWLKESK